MSVCRRWLIRSGARRRVSCAAAAGSCAVMAPCRAAAATDADTRTHTHLQPCCPYATTRRSNNPECVSTKAKLMLLLALLCVYDVFFFFCPRGWQRNEGANTLSGNHIRNAISVSSRSFYLAANALIHNTPLSSFSALPGRCGKQNSLSGLSDVGTVITGSLSANDFKVPLYW